MNIRALIYIGSDHKEISCSVTDICETGICFAIPTANADSDKFQDNQEIEFQFVDEFECVSIHRNDVVIGRCIIRHIEKNRCNTLIGCYISSSGYKKYVEARRLAKLARIYHVT